MTKYTKGPWKVGGPYPSISICTLEETEYGMRWDPMTILWDDVKHEAPDELKANAHLIAAAPDLLQACRKLKAPDQQ